MAQYAIFHRKIGLYERGYAHSPRTCSDALRFVLQRRATTSGKAAWVLATLYGGTSDVLWEESGNAWLVQADGAAREQRWLALTAGLAHRLPSVQAVLAQPHVSAATICDAIQRVVSNVELNSLATTLERRLETMAGRLERVSKDTNIVVRDQVQRSQQAMHAFARSLTERINMRETRPGDGTPWAFTLGVCSSSCMPMLYEHKSACI